jgi:pantoate--beta-alanine ligase
MVYRALTETAAALADGGVAGRPLATAREQLTDTGFAVDYFALVDGRTLEEIPRTAPGARLIAAARLGSVRLLDNIAA